MASPPSTMYRAVPGASASRQSRFTTRVLLVSTHRADAGDRRSVGWRPCRVDPARCHRGYRIVSPGELAGKVMKAEDLEKVWTGDFLLITRRFRGVGVEPTTYNYQWFLATIWRYRRPATHILAASVFLQPFAIVTPLFFQIII